MITGLELINFKCIKQHHFPLGNLNILTGLNGMGKSSCIEAILGFYQNKYVLLKNGYTWKLNGEIINLGTARDILYQYADSDFFSLKLKYIFDDEKPLTVSINCHCHDDEDSLKCDIDSDKAFKRKFLLHYFNSEVRYLAPDRGIPNSIHPRSRSAIDSRNIGINGEYAAHYLQEKGDENIAFSNMGHMDAKSLTLREQVNCWMGMISPGLRINVESLARLGMVQMDMQYTQPGRGYTNRFKPGHVGFGISYALPVVLMLLTAQAGDFIIVESPESHIHPKGQATLGRLAALAAANAVQVIFETHSDHIVNGIRVAIKENDIAPQRVRLFYFERKITDKEQYSQISNIQFDKQGELSEYPPELLAEWGNQLMRLL